MDINSAKSIVQDMLWKHIDLRDDDKRLIANIWSMQVKAMGLDVNTMSTFDFLKLYTSGKLYNAESIRRARQKSQEESPLLRGKNYKGKQNEQKRVKTDLGYTSTPADALIP